jgi:uncharacterized protein
MTEKERYDLVDMPFYRDVISPVLPDNVLDFHTHTWKEDQWKIAKDQVNCQYKNSASLGLYPPAKYMTTELEYGIERLLEDGNRMFPKQRYHAVIFGQPTPSAILELTNKYVADSSQQDNLFPLFITGKNLIPREQLEQQILNTGFFGYKVYLDWVGNDYGNVCVEDMIGPAEMELANEYSLVVLLHVPRSGRLADPEVARGVRELSKRYPCANIVLAHCGRCYRPEEMRTAVGSIADLENVYLDTSMVMDPSVLHILFDTIDSRRIMFATDFPVAAMRGRRVNVMDHWVDLVLEGYPESEFRVASNGIRASFMAYEIVLAIITAADTAGLSKESLKSIFYDNGVTLLRKVKGEKQAARINKA